MANGSPLHLCGSWSNALVPPPPTPIAMYAQILVTMTSTAQCTPVQPVITPCQATLHIIVWNVISVVDGNTQAKFATFRSAGDAIPRDMWLITAQSILLPNLTLTALIMGPTPTMTISTPLWMTTRKVRCVKPGAQIYKGGNVTIFFLSHVFFLIAIV